jgi:hypothetical protein
MKSSAGKIAAEIQNPTNEALLTTYKQLMGMSKNGNGASINQIYALNNSLIYNINGEGIP